MKLKLTHQIEFTIHIGPIVAQEDACPFVCHDDTITLNQDQPIEKQLDSLWFIVLQHGLDTAVARLEPDTIAEGGGILYAAITIRKVLEMNPALRDLESFKAALLIASVATELDSTPPNQTDPIFDIADKITPKTIN